MVSVPYRHDIAFVRYYKSLERNVPEPFRWGLIGWVVEANTHSYRYDKYQDMG